MKQSRFVLIATTAIVALVVAFAAGASAQKDIYVPDNVVGGSLNVIPFGGAWPSSSNPNGEFVYQWWIPANLLGGKPYRIVGLANLPHYTGVHTAQKAEILISHNTAATHSTVFAQNLPQPVTLLPESPWTWNVTKDTWTPMPLAPGAGFDYNGTDNLTIQIRLFGSKTSLQNATNLSCYNSSSGGVTRVYNYGTGTYSTLYGRGPTVGYGGKIRLTVNETTIVGSGSPSIGGKIDLDLFAAGDANLPYVAASSLGTGPIALGQRKLGLSQDNMFNASVSGVLPQIFQNYTGALDAQGKGRASINIPNLGVLVGVRIHSAFVTVKIGEPFNIKSISPTFSFSITT